MKLCAVSLIQFTVLSSFLYIVSNLTTVNNLSKFHEIRLNANQNLMLVKLNQELFIFHKYLTIKQDGSGHMQYLY